MKKYFVDTENVQSAWMELLETLEAKDHVYLMVSAHTPNLSFPLSLLERYSALAVKHAPKIQQVKCVDMVSHNAMDLELVSFLGSIMGTSRSKTCEYVIVSNDKDFDPVVSFWSDRGKKIRRMGIGNTLQEAKSVVSKQLSKAEVCEQPQKQVNVAQKAILENDNDKPIQPAQTPKINPYSLPENWANHLDNSAKSLLVVSSKNGKTTNTKREKTISSLQSTYPDRSFCIMLYNICKQLRDGPSGKRTLDARLTRRLNKLASNNKYMEQYLLDKVVPNVPRIIKMTA